MDPYELAYKWALRNAWEHGEAREGPVMGKVLAEAPDLRSRVSEVREAVRRAVERVNSMSRGEIEEEMTKYEYSLERRERKGLPELPGVSGRVRMRFAPEPGGYIHLGNLRAAMVNHLYVEKYGGEFILRYEDTNPEKAKLPYYEAIREDLEAVGIKIHEVYYQSDRFDIYYEYGRKLVEEGKAYFTFCPQEELRERRKEGKPCPEREKDPPWHMEVWDRVFEGDYSEGEVVLLLKTDPAHPNPALREPAIFRIIDSVPHPRTGYKYRFYPLFNFSNALDDALMEITHVLRGKDHENNGKIQGIIREYLGLRGPVVITHGRIRVEGGYPLGKRYIREGIRKGELEGWEDVKVPTVRSLLMRGILPETLREYFEEIGMKGADIVVDWDKIYAINRKHLDPRARRVFFVPDPVRIEIDVEREVEIPWHPDRDMGHRVYRVRGAVWISGRDAREGTVRLKYLGNFRISGSRGEYVGNDLIDPKIQWIPDLKPIYTVVKTPEGELTGYSELWAQTLKEGEIVQLERVGFARVIKNQGDYLVLAYAHP